MECDNRDSSDAMFHFTDTSGKSQDDINLSKNGAKNMGMNFQQVDLLLINQNKTLNNEGDIVCLNCGLTARDLIYEGRPGCPSCYKYFSSVFNTITENNNKKYSGRKPLNYVEILNVQHGPELNQLNIKSPDTAAELEDELKRAVMEERYEDAAGLRDKIKEVMESE